MIHNFYYCSEPVILLSNYFSEKNVQNFEGVSLIPTILCGGSGSRLWPISREMHPKQFIRMNDGQSLLQKAFLRGAMLPGVKDILTVTSHSLFFKMEEEFSSLEQTHVSSSFILEPFGRNTAPASIMAALQVTQQHGQDALLLVLAADHLITNHTAFQSSVSQAIELALDGKLVTFGVPVYEPNTGYGYIEADGHNVMQFIEKPALEQAKLYAADPSFLWNSGMFVFSAKTLLAGMSEHCPDLLAQAQACFHSAVRQKTQITLDSQAYHMIPNLSIDYALLEKSTEVAVVRCDIGWTDVGSWSVLGALCGVDELGNSVEGDAVLHDVTNSYIQSNSRLVGAVGVKDLIIIETADAVLVADKSCSQDVKHLYSQLQTMNHEAHKMHKTVHRPWGHYTVLEDSLRYKIKRIEVKPGASLSLQMHYHRSEHWVVVSGTANVINGDKVFVVHTNESTYIPAGCLHRLSNPGFAPLVMIEVQSGDYLGEDDIVRFEDSYGRICSS